MRALSRLFCNVLTILLGLGLLLPSLALAQQDQDQYEDLYADDAQYDENRMAIGFGAGIVLPEDQQGNQDGEIYYSVNFRWRLRGRKLTE